MRLLIAIIVGLGAGAAPQVPQAVARQVSPPAVIPAPNVAANCGVLPEPGEPVGTVGLADAVDLSHAPQPWNDSERLFFRQLYETLVRVDCEGLVQPALAASWRLEADGRTWIVTLRDMARFSDGSPVTATDVLAGWSTSAGGLRPQVGRLVESIAAVDERTLAIAVHEPNGPFPRALADASLAIVRRQPGVRWPLGTRPVRIVDESPLANGRSSVTIAGLPVSPSPEATASWSIRFVMAPARDRRDFLDEGVDLLLARDPVTLGYAATMAQFQSVPLEWRRVHVFLSPWRPAALPLSTAEARQALATDAIRGEARGAEEPFWWQAPSECEIVHPRPRTTPLPATGRIVYEQGDDASRDLAERLVGLARAPGTGSATILESLLPGPSKQAFQRAVGLSASALASTVERGDDAGYLVSLDRAPLDRCRALELLTARYKWLDPDAIVPLADTRLRALVRRGRSGLTAEWDGGLIITTPGNGR
jgi:hypothetical protein